MSERPVSAAVSPAEPPATALCIICGHRYDEHEWNGHECAKGGCHCASFELPAPCPADRKAAMPENDEGKDALAEAMFKAEYSDPNSDGADREWMNRGQYESGYRAEVVLGLLHEAGFDVVKVDV